MPPCRTSSCRASWPPASPSRAPTSSRCGSLRRSMCSPQSLSPRPLSAAASSPAGGTPSSAPRGMSTLRRPPALTWVTAPCSPCGSAPSLPTGLRWNIIWMPSRRRMPSTPRCSRRWQKAGLPGMDFKLPFSQAVCACTLEIKGVFFDGTECKRPAQGHAGPV